MRDNCGFGLGSFGKKRGAEERLKASAVALWAMARQERLNLTAKPMIGTSDVVSYFHNEGCHGVKIGFAFGILFSEKQGLSG